MRFPRVPRADFPRLLSSGKRIQGRFLTLIDGVTGSGDAIIVSKKVARTAVMRNRLRRALRAELRGGKATTGATLLIVRPGATKVPLRALRDELIGLKQQFSTSKK